MSSTNAASAVGISSDGEALTTSAIVAAEAVTGSHVLQIKGYSMTTKELGNGEHIKSSTFTVGGHRWYIRYYPDGNVLENAGWISIYLQHDHTNAAVEVKARFVFGVLDDRGKYVPMFTTDTSVDDTFSSKNRCWGFSQFVKRKDLEESSYIRDDCLKIRCDVIVSKGFSTEATMQLVVVPPSNMHRHFGSLLSGAVGTDVTFYVAGEMFAAHRCVLAARSSVFMAEIFGPMKEKAMNSIEIQDMEARVFEAMLHFIYTDTMPDIDHEDAFVITQHLLVAADRYDLERLKLICEDRLCNCIDTSNVVTTLALAERHGCHGLKNECFQLLKSSRHLKMAMATEGFDHLMTTCPSLMKELLAKVATCP
jgi:speckle-type POZ protein